MREIQISNIIDTVERLCMEANYFLNDDILQALEAGMTSEESETGKEIFRQLVENARIAREKQVPICQDTGMAVVFTEIGQEVHVVGGSLIQAIQEGVRRGYRNGYLRASVVRDPLDRVNTGDNTPAVVHYEPVEGDQIRLVVAPKGFGSENMSAVKMLKPSDGLDGVLAFVVEVVNQAGPNPCPPIVVGVGMGGTMEKAAFLAKKALLRPLDESSREAHLCEIEKELLKRVNQLGIGPAGLGGRITALAVHVESFPTHIAGLPVAVNISCHATRHAEAVI